MKLWQIVRKSYCQPDKVIKINIKFSEARKLREKGMGWFDTIRSMEAKK